MDETEIGELFNLIKGDAGDIPEDLKNVFSVLVSSTLCYRDRLKQDSGTTLTVEDVRVALDWLLEWMHTNKWPTSNHAVRLELLKIWVEELNVSCNYRLT
jgi:hypothetical protein